MKSLSVAALLALLLAASGCGKRLDPSFEGIIAVHMANSSGWATERTMECKNGKCRIQDTGGGTSSSIPFYTVVDTRLRELVIVLDGEKSFTKADYATVFATGLHPGDKPRKRTATNKRSSSTVAGFACSNWEVPPGDDAGREEVCATPFLDLAAARATAGREDGATGLPDPTLFPLRTVEFDSNGKEARRQEIVRIERRAIDDAGFAVPVGYTELKARPR